MSDAGGDVFVVHTQFSGQPKTQNIGGITDKVAFVFIYNSVDDCRLFVDGGKRWNDFFSRILGKNMPDSYLGRPPSWPNWTTWFSETFFEPKTPLSMRHFA